MPEVSVLLVILNAPLLLRLRGPRRDGSDAHGGADQPRQPARAEEKEPPL